MANCLGTSQSRGSLLAGIDAGSVCLNDSARARAGNHQVVASGALGASELFFGKMVALRMAPTIGTADCNNGVCGRGL